MTRVAFAPIISPKGNSTNSRPKENTVFPDCSVEPVRLLLALFSRGLIGQIRHCSFIVARVALRKSNLAHTGAQKRRVRGVAMLHTYRTMYNMPPWPWG